MSSMLPSTVLMSYLNHNLNILTTLGEEYKYRHTSLFLLHLFLLNNTLAIDPKGSTPIIGNPPMEMK
jgi:hypothetical protein